MWIFTVCSAITRWAAISALDSPRATSARTSVSRSVRWSRRLRSGPCGWPSRENSAIRRRVTDGASSASPAATRPGGQLPAEHRGPLPHPHHPMTGPAPVGTPAGAGQAIRRGPRRAVDHLQRHSVVPVLDLDPHLGAGRVLHRVAERLLQDPVGRQLHGRRQRAGRPGHGGGHRQPGGPAVGEQVVESVQAGLRRGVLCAAVRSQQAEHPPQLGERVECVGADGAEAADQLLRRVRHPVRRGLGLDRDHGHVVRDHIVQLPGEAGAFLQQGPAGPLRLADVRLLGEPTPRVQGRPQRAGGDQHRSAQDADLDQVR
jgi:hypothetical protein